LRFIFFGELDGELPHGGLAPCVEQAADEQRLVDVTHPHTGFEELQEFVGFHACMLPDVAATCSQKAARVHKAE
jgi:hypothetical protein